MYTNFVCISFEMPQNVSETRRHLFEIINISTLQDS